MLAGECADFIVSASSPSPFIIFSLPRSRTTWLSKFLSYGQWHCGHDELRHMRGLDDVKSWLAQPFTGSVETAAAPWWRLLKKYRPDVRMLVIRRSVEDVVGSLMRLELGFDRAEMTKLMRSLDAKLAQIERRMDAPSVRFEDLNDIRYCSAIFQFCLDRPFDKEATWRYAQLRDQNIQCSMSALIRYAAAFRPQMEKMKATAKHVSLADFARRPSREPDALTIQEEPFEQFLKDGAALFGDHSVVVGEHPDSFQSKNIPLFRALASVGNLQVVTARSNGRMFGYLVTVLSASLEAADRNSAVHIPVYASPEFPGLGMKLQRYALATLIEKKGRNEIWGRAGSRGSGDRMGAMYRRLGFVPDGELYRLMVD